MAARHQPPDRASVLRPFDQAEWVRSVKNAVFGSWPEFAKFIGAPEDTAKKWANPKPQEPGFTYTRRIVLVAPPSLVSTFVGRPEIETHGLSGVRSIPGGAEIHPPEISHMHSVQASALAEALDGIEDKSLRGEVMRKCLNLIAEAHHPSELGAERRPGRAQRK